MPKSGVTIVDIAHELGISKTAVSSALHGSGRVSETLRERVLSKAEEMGYERNRAAQRLRGGRHGAIGMQIPEDVQELAFYMEFAFGVAARAATLGQDLVLLANGDAKRSSSPAIDGVLALDATAETFAAALAAAGSSPVVSVGEYRGPGHERQAAWIAADHRKLIEDLLEVLASAGYTAPALVGFLPDREPLWGAQLRVGYEQWCARTGRDPHLYNAQIALADADMLDIMQHAAEDGADAVIWAAQGHARRAEAMQAAQGSAPMLMASMALGPSDDGMAGVDLRARDYGQAATDLLFAAINGTVEPGASVLHEARIVAPR